MSHLLLTAVLLVASPGLSPAADSTAWTGDVEACKSKLAIKMDPPSGNDLNLVRTKYCAASNGKPVDQKFKSTSYAGKERGACSATHLFMIERYQSYANLAADACAEVLKLKPEGTTSFQQAAELNQKAAKPIRDLAAKLERDKNTLKDLRDKNLKAAEEEVKAAGNPADLAAKQKAAVAQTSFRTSEEKVKAVDASLAIPAPGKLAGEQMAASQEALRFGDQLNSQISGLKATLGTLDAQAEDLRRRDLGQRPPGTDTQVPPKTSGSGIGMGDLLPWAVPLATLGLGAMAYMQSQKSQEQTPPSLPPMEQNNVPSTSESNTPQNPPTAPLKPLVATGLDPNKNASTAGSKVADPNSGFNGGSTFPGGAPFGSSATGDSSDGLLSRFDGSLGGSPVTGPSTAADGAAGGSGGSGASRDPAGLDSLLQHKPTDASATLNFGGGGGGGGSASFGGGVDSGLKDSFKADLGASPLALDGGAPPAGAPWDPLTTSSGAETFDNANEVPGADDARTLFARVKELHKKCLKKGCVSFETAGRI